MKCQDLISLKSENKILQCCLLCIGAIRVNRVLFKMWIEGMNRIAGYITVHEQTNTDSAVFDLSVCSLPPKTLSLLFSTHNIFVILIHAFCFFETFNSLVKMGDVFTETSFASFFFWNTIIDSQNYLRYFALYVASWLLCYDPNFEKVDRLIYYRTYNIPLNFFQT